MKKLIVLTGPTAVGKSSLSIKLAHDIGGEIISADSIQVYKELNIGSAKITREQMDGITHYLIDVLEPSEPFNVYLFKKMALEALERIYANGHIPIVVGGTGFYIQALLYDIDFSEEDNAAIRKKLEEEALKYGNQYMHDKLSLIDPEYAKIVHFNNVKKVIRALEYIELNNELFSVHNETERKNNSPYDFKYFVLTDKREKLYEKINMRVDQMVDEGLLDEVKALKNKGYDASLNSMQGLGYKEILMYLNDEMSFEEAIELIKQKTRNFAKRQLTWFRREKEVIFIDKSTFDYDENEILKFIEAKVNE